MIKFKFSVSLIDNNVSAFEQGNIEIKHNDDVISSRNKIPDQSLMIFTSLSELLDSVSRAISGKNNRIKFIGTDSSFFIEIFSKDQFLYISNSETTIYTTHDELANSLYNEAHSFYKIYQKDLEKNNYLDLINSLNNFKIICSPS